MTRPRFNLEAADLEGLVGKGSHAVLCGEVLSDLLTPLAAFLHVGQGDAAVLRGASGATVVVDTGPDPVVLADTLMLRSDQIASMRLAPADTAAADLTGPASGHAIEITLLLGLAPLAMAAAARDRMTKGRPRGDGPSARLRTLGMLDLVALHVVGVQQLERVLLQCMA